MNSDASWWPAHFESGQPQAATGSNSRGFLVFTKCRPSMSVTDVDIASVQGSGREDI